MEWKLGTGHPGHVLRVAVATLSAAMGSAAGTWSSSEARGEGAGGANWPRLDEGEGVQGWMMLVSRPLGHALHSQSLFARKPFLRVRWKKFSFQSRGAYCRIFPLFVGPSTVIFQRRFAVKTYAFLFREKTSRVSRRLLILLRAKSLQSHGSSRLFFLFGMCRSSDAEGRAREEYFSGLSESPRRAAHVKPPFLRCLVRTHLMALCFGATFLGRPRFLRGTAALGGVLSCFTFSPFLDLVVSSSTVWARGVGISFLGRLGFRFGGS
jgi:hypothetical protein